jgi:rSAM/selenodomain-associated transferase 1
MPASADTVLIVYARAPVPGRVKTRLVPLLGADGAARLHKRMVRHALRTAMEAGFTRVELHCTPGVADPFFRQMHRRYGVRLRSQGRGDLGARMRRAFERALRSHPRAILIGSDCPALEAADLRAARRALQSGADAVFAPAEDGGYPLVGLRRASRRLFDGMPWGGPLVMARTRDRLRALRWRWRELRTVWDVDRPEDVARLREAGLPRGH